MLLIELISRSSIFMCMKEAQTNFMSINVCWLQSMFYIDMCSIGKSLFLLLITKPLQHVVNIIKICLLEWFLFKKNTLIMFYIFSRFVKKYFQNQIGRPHCCPNVLQTHLTFGKPMTPELLWKIRFNQIQ